MHFILRHLLETPP